MSQSSLLEQCASTIPEDLREVICTANLCSTTLDIPSSLRNEELKLVSDWCTTWGLDREALSVRHIEVVGNIAVLNTQSFSGILSKDIWTRINSNTLDDQVKKLLCIILKVYNCNRIGIHEEIDCGKSGLGVFIVGPKRQSHSRIVFSLSVPDDGWVSIRQVRIPRMNDSRTESFILGHSKK